MPRRFFAACMLLESSDVRPSVEWGLDFVRYTHSHIGTEPAAAMPGAAAVSVGTALLCAFSEQCIPYRKISNPDQVVIDSPCFDQDYFEKLDQGPLMNSTYEQCSHSHVGNNQELHHVANRELRIKIKPVEKAYSALPWLGNVTRKLFRGKLFARARLVDTTKTPIESKRQLAAKRINRSCAVYEYAA
ncbi:unnamed protein product [Calypogeia fissa]